MLTVTSMDAAQLALLPLDKQIDLIYHTGVYLAKRKAGGGSVLLFSLSSQYAEIYYKNYRCDIDRISYSEGSQILEPYLQQVDIKELA